MIISNKTIEILANLINEKTVYRKGSELVRFFNRLGFNDSYGQGFPTRYDYTIDKLKHINGTPELDQCIKNLFAPIEFAEDLSRLDCLINELNKYLAFDGWLVVRKNTEITFKRADIDIDKKIAESTSNDEQEFLQRQYQVELSSLSLFDSLEIILQARLKEINKSMSHDMPLSAIILTGSTLEGIFLNLASTNPKDFNQAKSAPKDNKTNKAKQFQDWTLNNYIDVAYELNYINLDVKKFSHVLKDFRNYIHPFAQMNNNFNPDIHTAEICFQVLKAAIYQISNH